MTKEEIIDVLTLVRAGDNRTIGQGDVEMWHLIIGDLPKNLALNAVIHHRKTQPGTWLEPGHINQTVHTTMRETAQRDDYPITTITNPNTNIGIDQRTLTTGKTMYRFFYEDTHTTTCGQWRDTAAQAQTDATNHQNNLKPPQN